MLTNRPPIQLRPSYLSPAAKRSVCDADNSSRLVLSLRISGVLIQIPHTLTYTSYRQIKLILHLSNPSFDSLTKIPTTPAGEEGGRNFHEGHSTVGEWQGSGRVVARSS
jgi:hypothetical protein